MSRPRAGRISIAQKLIDALRNNLGTEHARLVTKALKEEEARTLRVSSTRLRREASKLRAKEDGDVVDRATSRLAANKLDHFADKFLHEAQALEKKVG